MRHCARCLYAEILSGFKAGGTCAAAYNSGTGASCEVLYSASKAAVIGFTKALAKEVGPSGINVNCIAPGIIKTDMLSCYSEEDLEILAQETPLSRLGSPMDIASAAFFLASEGADFITGQILGVNGGFLI